MLNATGRVAFRGLFCPLQVYAMNQVFNRLLASKAKVAHVKSKAATYCWLVAWFVESHFGKTINCGRT